MRVTLHIGTHKTGTTFIQQQVEAQRQHLRAQGVHYLRDGPNHSWLYLLFCDAPEMEHAAMRRGLDGRDAAQAWAAEKREALQREILEAATPRVLISGEDICRMDEGALLSLLGWLAEMADEIDVLCCVRDPAGYVISDAQESIKGGLTWEEALACPPKAHFRTALTVLARELGRQPVKVFPFPAKGSSDLLGTFALQANLALRPAADGASNRSLSAEAAIVLSTINRAFPMFLADRTNAERASIPAGWLEGVGKTAFTIPDAYLARATEALEGDYNWLSEFVGEEWFDRNPPSKSTWQPFDEQTLNLLRDVAMVLHQAARTVDETLVAYLLQSAELSYARSKADEAGLILERLLKYKPSAALRQRVDDLTQAFQSSDVVLD